MPPLDGEEWVTGHLNERPWLGATSVKETPEECSSDPQKISKERIQVNMPFVDLQIICAIAKQKFSFGSLQLLATAIYF